MPAVLTLVAAAPEALAAAQARLTEAGLQSQSHDILEPQRAVDHIFEAEPADLSRSVHETLEPLPVDYALQPAGYGRKRLLLADMDSTIIGCECLDELADYAGLKEDVAAVTERAMRGELAFEPALAARVALLRGLSVDMLQRCFEERVRLNPGARTLVATMRAHEARTILVSGGFTFFADRVAGLAGFDEAHANTLLDDGRELTGEVARPILGREAKLERLNAACEALGIKPREALAIGDGANDLDMVQAAGLGVAYKAKPALAAAAPARIAYTDLTAALYFQGYRREDWREA